MKTKQVLLLVLALLGSLMITLAQETKKIGRGTTDLKPKVSLPETYIKFSTLHPRGTTIQMTVLSEPNFYVDWGDGNLVEVESQYFTDLSGTALGTTIRLYGDGIQGLTCVGARMNAIDVTHCPELVILSVSANELSQIDVSKNPALERLTCARNKLTELDVASNANLLELVFFENQISTIDISHNRNLQKLITDDNPILELNLSSNRILSELQCSGNKLTTLDLTNNEALELLALNNVGLDELNLTAQAEVIALLANGNNLTSIQLSHMPKLRKIAVRGNRIESLDVSHNPKLFSIECDSNRIKTLDLTNCKELMRLSCSHNEIKEIDPSPSKDWLSELILARNPLTGLPDFKDYSKLQILDVARVGAKKIVLSDVPRLIFVDVSGNDLSANALDAFYTALPDLSGKQPDHSSMLAIFGKCIVYHNPGVSSALSAIATDKTWQLVKEDPMGMTSISATDIVCRYDRFSGQFVFSSKSDVINFWVYDSSGRLISQMKDSGMSATLPEGLYLVRIQLANGRVFTAKVRI